MVLPAPFGTEEAVELAAFDRQIEPVDDRLLAVGLGESPCAERRQGSCAAVAFSSDTGTAPASSQVPVLVSTTVADASGPEYGRNAATCSGSGDVRR